jgi:hypothetical protein
MFIIIIIGRLNNNNNNNNKIFYFALNFLVLKINFILFLFLSNQNQILKLLKLGGAGGWG